MIIKNPSQISEQGLSLNDKGKQTFWQICRKVTKTRNNDKN